VRGRIPLSIDQNLNQRERMNTLKVFILPHILDGNEQTVKGVV